MSRIIWLAVRMYSLMIRLYPASFRKDFEAEMIDVFDEKITDVARMNKWGLPVILLRELRDLPVSWLRQHWHNFAPLESNPMTTIKRPKWFFYPAWIILPTLVAPIAFVLFLAIFYVIGIFVGDYIYVNGERHSSEDFLGGYILFPIIILLTGVVQYWLLRRYLPRMGWWVLATAVGWFLGFVLIFSWFRALTYFGTADLMSEFWATDLTFVAMGLSIGMGQWLLLRRRLPRAGWWIVSTAVGWSLLRLAVRDSFGSVQFQLIVLGLLPACTTAVTLAWLINEATPPESHGVSAHESAPTNC